MSSEDILKQAAICLPSEVLEDIYRKTLRIQTTYLSDINNFVFDQYANAPGDRDIVFHTYWGTHTITVDEFGKLNYGLWMRELWQHRLNMYFSSFEPVAPS